MVNAPVPVADQCPCRSVQSPHHLLLGPAPQPAVDILRQQVGEVGKHTVIIFGRDIQIGADLSVGGGLDVQRLHQIHIIVVNEPQKRASPKGLHLKVAGFYKIVLLGQILAQNLGAQFVDGQAAFHIEVSPLSFVFRRPYQVTATVFSLISAASPSPSSTYTS